MTKDRSEDINRYLTDEMSAAERAAFEAELAQDPSLQKELMLWQDMEQALRPDEEDALRENLQQLRQKYDADEEAPSGKGIKPIYLLLAILALLVVVLLVNNWQGTSAAKSETNTTEITEPIPPQSPGNEQSAPSTIPDRSLEPTEDVPAKDPEQEATPPIEPDKSPPIAANFTPNPQLESLIGQQLRSNDFNFALSSPPPNAAPGFLSFTGTLESNTEPGQFPSFKLLLFSNKPEAYQNYQPLYSENLRFEKADGSYTFSHTTEQTLPAGLYYYLIEDEDSGMLYWVDKVVVQ